MPSYYIAKDRFGNYNLAHGIQWRQHKYIRKEGNRYIYPEDLKKKQQAQNAANLANQRGFNRTVSYIGKGIKANYPGISLRNANAVANGLVEKQGTNGPSTRVYKHYGQLAETKHAAEKNPINIAQEQGKKRTADENKRKVDNAYKKINKQLSAQNAIKKAQGRGKRDTVPIGLIYDSSGKTKEFQYNHSHATLLELMRAQAAKHQPSQAHVVSVKELEAKAKKYIKKPTYVSKGVDKNSPGYKAIQKGKDFLKNLFKKRR